MDTRTNFLIRILKILYNILFVIWCFNELKCCSFRQLPDDDLPSFTELQDADNEIVTTLHPNKELGSEAQILRNTNTVSPLTLTGQGAASIKPILQLKPVPEIVKPSGPTTRRPHTFIRLIKYQCYHSNLQVSTPGGQRLYGPKSLPSRGLSPPSRTAREWSLCPRTVTMICLTPGISSRLWHQGGSSSSAGPAQPSSAPRRFSSNSWDPSTRPSHRSRTTRPWHPADSLSHLIHSHSDSGVLGHDT